MVVLAVPMSVLVAVLMAFGDLSSKHEITAMKASGVSIYRMMAPVIVAAGCPAVLLVMFNNDVLPEANHKAKSLTMDIRRKRPTFSIVAGLFSQEIQGYSILVHKTFEKTNDLEGITLYDYTNPNYNVVITAKRGTISFSPDARKLIMDLQEGEIHELNLVNMAEYKRIRFQKHRIVTEVEGFGFERTQEGTAMRGDRELSAAAMRRIVDCRQRAYITIDSNLKVLLEREMARLLSGRLPPLKHETPPATAGAHWPRRPRPGRWAAERLPARPARRANYTTRGRPAACGPSPRPRSFPPAAAAPTPPRCRPATRPTSDGDNVRPTRVSCVHLSLRLLAGGSAARHGSPCAAIPIGPAAKSSPKRANTSLL